MLGLMSLFYYIIIHNKHFNIIQIKLIIISLSMCIKKKEFISYFEGCYIINHSFMS